MNISREEYIVLKILFFYPDYSPTRKYIELQDIVTKVKCDPAYQEHNFECHDICVSLENKKLLKQFIHEKNFLCYSITINGQLAVNNYEFESNRNETFIKLAILLSYINNNSDNLQKEWCQITSHFNLKKINYIDYMFLTFGHELYNIPFDKPIQNEQKNRLQFKLLDDIICYIDISELESEPHDK